MEYSLTLALKTFIKRDKYLKCRKEAQNSGLMEYRTIATDQQSKGDRVTNTGIHT